MNSNAREDLADTVLLEKLRADCQSVRKEVGKIVLGQDDVVDLLLISVLADGHAILEGVPGLAKTLLVQTLSQSLSLTFARIQFTPDLMPSDITGTEVMFEDKASGNREFRFLSGPIFRNIVLADEINRTPPKTQAALLEAMQERQVSSAGTLHALPKPFFVLATQNPIEQEGTYPLPEAQLDRFLVKAVVHYPPREIEREIYKRVAGGGGERLKAVLDAAQVIAYQQLVRRVPVNDTVLDFAVNLLRSMRPGGNEAPDFIREYVQFGPGPRAGQALISCARAKAALAGRPEVDVDDLRSLAKPVLRHRIVLTFAAEAASRTPDAIIDQALAATPLHAAGDAHVHLKQVLRS
ncbi:MAG: MoxR family ATPase [Planctomycetes bacterium]|nr:MoxR family ATPase [Planctomycetota bacterium]